MRYYILFPAIFFAFTSCSDPPVAPPHPFDEYDGPAVSMFVEPFRLNEGDETELTLTVRLDCHRQIFSAFEKDVTIHFAIRVGFGNGPTSDAEEGVDYTVEIKPLALPAYTTQGQVKIPIRILADDQEERFERIEFIIDRIVDADGNEIEFWGPAIRWVSYSIKVEEGG